MNHHLMNASLRCFLPVFVLAGLFLNCSLAKAEAGSAQKLQFETPFADNQSEPVIVLRGQDARWQLQLTQHTNTNIAHDRTTAAQYRIEPSHVARISSEGLLTPLENGSAIIKARYENQTAEIAVKVQQMEHPLPVNFSQQIVPLFTKFGCNGGGCHGKASGQAGFRLSLLGAEPQEDYEHLVYESRGRRVFPALPESSLLLKKALNTSPHGGGQRLDQNSHEYRLLVRWIATGMPYGEQEDPYVTSIRVIPEQRVMSRSSQQQLSVVALYNNGDLEDITRTAQYESNQPDLASVDVNGKVQLTEQNGDVAIMARYQGNVAVFNATIPTGIDVAELPQERNLVDTHVFNKLKQLGIPPSEECEDSTFIRRVTLDIAGRLPTLEETSQFLSSTDPTKHEQVVDRLLNSQDYANHFAKKWSTILRNRRPSAAHQFKSFAFHQWLLDNFHQNRPYDQFVRDLLTANGSVETNPAVAWLGEVNSTEQRLEDSAQMFLGQRLQCAKCHHHPYEKWSQKDYYHMAAFFSTVSKKEGFSPEQPVYFSGRRTPSARHPKTNQTLKPAGLNSEELDISVDENPRAALVDWMSTPENPYFAKMLVNRYWKHFFSAGIVEPEDDMRVTNPPRNPELLDHLAEHFIESGFDLKQLIRTICSSTTYRLSSNGNAYNVGLSPNYARYYPKRLQAEVLLDAVDTVTESSTQFSGMPLQVKAMTLPDTSYNSYFLKVFGQPDSTTACECERSSEATLAQSLHLMNSEEVQSKLKQGNGLAARMAKSDQPIEVLIHNLYLTALSRTPEPAEVQTAKTYLESKSDSRQEAYEDLVWAILNSKEFLFNH